MNKGALQAAVESLATSQKMRLLEVDDIGGELEKIEKKESTLPAKTRAVLRELAGRYQVNLENGISL